MLTRAFLHVPARLRVELQGGVISQAYFHGSGGCANCLPSLVSPRALSAGIARCHRKAAGCVRLLFGHRHRVSFQLSASRAALQTGRSEDVLEYHLLAFSLASELFVALTDMKIPYQRGMSLLLSKIEFHLSPERAVMTVGFFPIASLNFSSTLVFKCRAGDWLTVQQTAGGSLFLCSTLPPERLAYCSQGIKANK